MRRAATRIPRRGRARAVMHQAPPARRQGSPAALTQLRAQARAAAEGSQCQGSFPGLGPSLSAMVGQRTTRGHSWVASHGGFSFSLLSGKQREWEVS